MLIPQSLSYDSLTGLDTAAGLYTSFFPLLIYVILGTSRHLGVGAEAALSLLVGSALANSATPEDRAIDAAVLTFLVGAISLLMGLFRWGQLDCLLSRATSRGFITGVALVVIVEQLPLALGLTSKWTPSDSTAIKFVFVMQHLYEAQLLPCLFSSIGVAFLVATSIIQQKFGSKNLFIRVFPSIVIVVVVSEMLAWGLALDMPIVGDVRGGFVPPAAPQLTMERVSHLITEAVIIVIIGYVEANIVAKEMANKHAYTVSGNRELVAFGVANLVACFFGAYPAFSSVPRTAVREEKRREKGKRKGRKGKKWI